MSIGEDFHSQDDNGKIRTSLYKVRWEGYDKKDDTWDPITYLQGYVTMVKSFKESHVKDLEKLPVDRQCQEAKTSTDDLVKISKHTVWMREKPNPYISNDKFSQEDIFHCWAGRLSGYAHVNQTYPDVIRMWRQFHGCPASGGGIE